MKKFLSSVLIFFGLTLQANYYEGSKLGYVDNIVINNISFDDLNNRNIAFYKEDLKNGNIEIKGILEAENKLPIEQLYVEVSTDGGKSWNKANGHENWTYHFVPTKGKNYQLSLRVIQENNSAKSDKNQKMLMRNAMADVYGKKIIEATKTIEKIINSDKFKKGNIAQFKETLKDIQNILINTDINIQRGKGKLDNLPGRIDIPEEGKENSGIIDIGDVGAYGSSSSSSVLDGGFSKAALDGWNHMCSDLSYLQHSGNGDLVGRNSNMNNAAKNCQKVKGSLGFKDSKYMDSTATNSPVTSSPYLKDGESLGNYAYESKDTDEDKQAETDKDGKDEADANQQDANDADEQAKAEEEAEAERIRQEEQAKKDKEEDENEDEESRRGGDSPDPVDNEEGGKPISARALKEAQKMLSKKNPFSSSAQGGKAGGRGDGRGAEKDDSSNGTMIYTPGTLGSTDDERLQNNNSNVAGGAMKTTIKEQLGGGIKVQEK